MTTRGIQTTLDPNRVREATFVKAPREIAAIEEHAGGSWSLALLARRAEAENA